MAMLLRTFKIPRDFGALLKARAETNNISSGKLVRGFIEDYLVADAAGGVGFPRAFHDDLILRSYYLSQEQDGRLRALADTHGTTKGAVVRDAIARGLGM